MTMTDYLITSLQSWDIEIGSTIKNTALEISHKHRVFYVNTPPSLMQWLRNKQIRAHKKEKLIHSNLYIVYCNFPAFPVSSMPFRWLFNIVNYINNYNIARAVRKAMQRHQIEHYIHLIDTDVFRSRYLKQLLHPDLSIYYRRDYVIGVDYWKKYGTECEQALVQQSDMVITNSSYFTEELKSLNSHVFTTNTGVNLQLYDANILHEVPVDLQPIPSPIIGYTGAVIERRLDSELLYAVARQLPECHFVFVGPEDEYFKMHPLHKLPNVYFLGKKEVEELPQYIQHFDVCINPQKVNPITEGNYPLKIDEYLAMGKPVVATTTHTMRDVFSLYSHLADGPESWVKKLQKALNETNKIELSKRRIAFAHTHSWRDSISIIYQAIENYQKTHVSSNSQK